MMPSAGAIIGGIVMVLVGACMVFWFQKFAEFFNTIEFRGLGDWWRGSRYYKFCALFGGFILMWFGLHTLDFSGLSTLLLIPAVLLIFHYKKVARAVMDFFWRPPERTIIKGQRILLVLTLVLIAGAVYVSVKDWVAIAAE